jgi:hypothetical protein
VGGGGISWRAACDGLSSLTDISKPKSSWREEGWAQLGVCFLYFILDG